MELMSRKTEIKKTKLQFNKISIRQWHPNFIGIVFVLLALTCSLLPSLLPRPWLIQGFVSGMSMALGYGLGMGCSFLYRWFIQKEPNQIFKKVSWKSLKLIAPITILISLYLGRIWQNQVRELLGVERIYLLHSLLVVSTTIIFFGVFFYIGRLVYLLSQKIKSFYLKKLPPRLGVALAMLTTLLTIYLLISGLLFSTFLRVADSAFGTRDNTAPDGVFQPKNSNRSGSQESLIPWDKIGFQGRGFVGRGPTKDEISKYHSEPAADPIRVYAGLASADTAQGRADLALAELKRTKAFDREVLVIATATGTGWLDPVVVDSLEYVNKGDSAIVSQQYSYLPSWISFLVDQDRAREAGRVLYDTILEEWSSLPEDERPKLLVYGLSLGSFGGQDAFSGVNDIRRSVDGALFTGTPNDTELWRTITDNRDQGSPEWQPKYKSEQSVVFASSREDIELIEGMVLSVLQQSGKIVALEIGGYDLLAEPKAICRY